MNNTSNYNLNKPESTDNYNVTDQNENMDTIDTQMKANAEAIDAHLSDYTLQIPYELTAGAVNTYAVTLTPAPEAYVEGMALAIKIHVDNTGASVINVNALGAKTIKKPNGNDVSAGNLKVGSIYTLRYNGTNFILQGSDAAGDAIPGDVLSGKTFSNDEGEQTGTMPNRGAHNITPGTSPILIPGGYHNGDGQVASLGGDAAAANVLSGKTFSSDVAGRAEAGAMANRAGHVAAQSTAVDGSILRFRPEAGYYPGDVGNSVSAYDANFIAGNILNGISIFGKNGTLIPGAVLNSIQSGVCYLDGSYGKDVTITSVDRSKAFLVFSYQTPVASPATSLVRGSLSSDDTISFRTGAIDPIDVHVVWQVLEFTSRVSVQYGTGYIPAGTSAGSETISPVDTSRTFVIATFSTGETSPDYYFNSFTQNWITGASSDTLLLQRLPASSGVTVHYDFFVVEFE